MLSFSRHLSRHPDSARGPDMPAAWILPPAGRLRPSGGHACDPCPYVTAFMRSGGPATPATGLCSRGAGSIRAFSRRAAYKPCSRLSTLREL